MVALRTPQLAVLATACLAAASSGWGLSRWLDLRAGQADLAATSEHLDEARALAASRALLPVGQPAPPEGLDASQLSGWREGCSLSRIGVLERIETRAAEAGVQCAVVDGQDAAPAGADAGEARDAADRAVGESTRVTFALHATGEAQAILRWLVALEHDPAFSILSSMSVRAEGLGRVSCEVELVFHPAAEQRG